MKSKQKIMLEKLVIFFPFLLFFLFIPYYIEHNVKNPPETVILRFLLFFGLFLGSFVYYFFEKKEHHKKKQKSDLLFILTIIIFLFVPNYLWGDHPISFVFNYKNIIIDLLVLTVGFIYGLLSVKIDSWFRQKD